MTAVTMLTIVLLVAATAACVALVWLSREAVATARSLRTLSDDVHERVVPMLDKADVTIDATNAELLRIDAAITRFEEASVRVSAASGTLSEIVQAPEKLVTGMAGRVRRAWKDRKRAHPEGEPSAQDEAEEEAEFDDALAESLDVAASEGAADALGEFEQDRTDDE